MKYLEVIGLIVFMIVIYLGFFWAGKRIIENSVALQLQNFEVDYEKVF